MEWRPFRFIKPDRTRQEDRNGIFPLVKRPKQWYIIPPQGPFVAGAEREGYLDMTEKIVIRSAVEEDTPFIKACVHELAEYERAADCDLSSEELLSSGGRLKMRGKAYYGEHERMRHEKYTLSLFRLFRFRPRRCFGRGGASHPPRRGSVAQVRRLTADRIRRAGAFQNVAG